VDELRRIGVRGVLRLELFAQRFPLGLFLPPGFQFLPLLGPLRLQLGAFFLAVVLLLFEFAADVVELPGQFVASAVAAEQILPQAVAIDERLRQLLIELRVFADRQLSQFGAAFFNLGEQLGSLAPQLARDTAALRRGVGMALGEFLPRLLEPRRLRLLFAAGFPERRLELLDFGFAIAELAPLRFDL
jgi:hypothetical protein